MTDQFTDDVNRENDDDTMSSQNEEQDSFRIFIEQYEISSELWNPTHLMYLKKAARSSALDRLIPFLVKIKLGANKREDVKKKINSLRTNYRKDLTKIAASKRSGKSTDELYTPSSWVFFALSFLERFEKPVMQQPTEAAVEQKLEQEEDSLERQIDEQIQQTSVNTASTSSMIPPPSPRETHQNKKLKTLGAVSKQNILLQKACSLLETPSNPESNIPTIAKAWGKKLLTLESRQRAFAEKAINDVLFEASLDSLHRHSVQINVEQIALSSNDSNYSSSFTTYNLSTSPLQFTLPNVTTSSDESNVQTMDFSATSLFGNFKG